ncbi:TPA: hypothetical protein ACSXXW_000935 [Pseudomonas aeruginosa]
MKLRMLLVVTMLMTAGCGNEAADAQMATPERIQFKVDTTDSSVLQALPAIRMACPGLDRYSSQFENIRVESLYRTSVVFHIPERASIPKSFMAGGHDCFVEIEPDGKEILIEKTACKSVCLDKKDFTSGQLVLSLASREEVRRHECLTTYGYNPETKETFEFTKPAHCK